ncbi:response regulator [Geotalea sp. SG265]|uniref:response regulator n=1 Tax=Geotalea sp. SG265 TaxID=2922867 RepID=UPI001FAF9918|nr:response regulator [Geotalea sp. SG265]
MLIICPSCKARFSFDDSRIGPQGIKLRCSKCRTIFSISRKVENPAPVSVAAPPAPPTAAAPAAQKVKVVIANESASFCAAVAKILEPEPFEVLTYNDGKEAFEAVQRVRPDVILLDVALPSMYGFEVCERIRQDPALAAVKIILIAAIYDKTRYKRSPASLYGADDYIEKHHIPDSLVSMIYRHVTNQKPVEKSAKEEGNTAGEGLVKPQYLNRQEVDAQLDARRQIQADEERETMPQVAPPAAQASSQAHEKAKRLARIIVSDIMLYNQAKVEEGIKNGTFYTLLEDDIREGRALYERRVPEEIRKDTSFLQAAFEDLIAKKKQELKL